jgi:hypothetical protein
MLRLVLSVMLVAAAMLAQSTASWKTIEAGTLVNPPAWATLERQLIGDMSRAAFEFAGRYTRPGGTLIWKTSGSASPDDPYESFYNYPLLYALGGDARLRDLSFTEWNAITRQLTDDFRAMRVEFPKQDDWFHHGEGTMFFYLLGLADPTDYELVKRAKRFAGLYMNEDPEAQNYDPKLKMIRSPRTGSAGPYFGSAERARPFRMAKGMAVYGMPIEGVPGIETIEDLQKPGAPERYGVALQERLYRGGDVPPNLAATSLVTNAYLFTGDAKYADWVKEYTGAWVERTRANSGIVPDNVGLSGKVGEYFDGKWWGGLYGWRWPHGYHTVGQPIQIAAANALLITGDRSYLEMPRTTMDAVIAQGRRTDRGWVVPSRRDSSGWLDFGRMDYSYLSALWFMSLADEDWQRVERVRQAEGTDWRRVADTHTKMDNGHEQPWLRFLAGDFPEYPERILSSAAGQVRDRLQKMRDNWLLLDEYPGTYHRVDAGKGDFTKLNEHHWQQQNPVTTEALIQLMLGAPQMMYNGGLLHASVRYFDPARQRPGVPPNVAALVRKIGADGIVVELVNLSPFERSDVILQAGTFGEHSFTTVKYARQVESESNRRRRTTVEESVAVEGKTFQVRLSPGAGITLEAGMRRFVNKPTYAFPWHGDAIPVR